MEKALPVPLCIVCEIRPQHRDALPVCSVECREKLRRAQSSARVESDDPGTQPSRRRSIFRRLSLTRAFSILSLRSRTQLCEVCKQRPKDRDGCLACANKSTHGFSSGRATSSIVDSTAPVVSMKRSAPQLCIVCGVLPLRPDGQSTCSPACAEKLQARKPTKSLCTVCGIREQLSSGGKQFQTCGLTCAEKLSAGVSSRNEHTSTRTDHDNRAHIEVVKANPEQRRTSLDDYSRNAAAQDGREGGVLSIPSRRSRADGAAPDPPPPTTLVKGLNAAVHGGREDEGMNVPSKRSHADGDVSDWPTSGALVKASSGPLCIVCRRRPQHRDTHPACSLECRERLRHAQTSAFEALSTRSRTLLCEVCKQRFKYQDEPTCLACASKSTHGNSSGRAGSNIVDPPAPAALMKHSAPELCIVCGAQRRDGQSTCSRACAEELQPDKPTKSLCIVCGIREPYSGGRKQSQTCSLCAAKLAGVSSPYEHTPARPDPYDNRYAHFISSGSAHLMQLDRPDPFDRARIDVNRADPEQYRMSSDDYGQNAPVQDGREDQGPSVLSKRSHANSDVSDLWSSGALSSVPICVVCETRPQNPHTHPFCSRYCREEFRHAQSSARVGRDGPDTGMSRAPSMRSPMLLCEICKKRPKYQDDQPACFPCAINSAKGYSSRRAGSNIVDSSAPALTKRPPPPLCVVCGVQPLRRDGQSICSRACAEELRLKKPTKSLCTVCGIRERYSNGRKHFQTCGLTCANKLKRAGVYYGRPSAQPDPYNPAHMDIFSAAFEPPPDDRTKQYHVSIDRSAGVQDGREDEGPSVPSTRSRADSDSSDLPNSTALVKASSMPLFIGGNPQPIESGARVQWDGPVTQISHEPSPSSRTLFCEVCKQLPKQDGQSICLACAEKSCLMCLLRPKNGRHDFCGVACKEIAMTTTPLLLEVPMNHVTFKLVARKFKAAWNHPQKQGCPQVKIVYRIVESLDSLTRYTNYKREHGKECFRYHGTRRECKLGDAGHQYPCWSNTCPACCILRTSFKVSVANARGAFGKGVYTSSASNKSANYSPNGILFLTKVTLGKVRYVQKFAEVKECPPGFNSVVFDRLGGRLNETVVYSDDAIRPVFLIVFG